MRTGVMLAVAALSVFSGCGGGGGGSSAPTNVPPPPPVATRAEVSLEITPASPVARPTGDAAYPWRVDWTLNVRETAGLGGNVNFVDVSFVNSFGFEVPRALNYGASEIIDRAGTNHVRARGELQIPLSMLYRADGFGGRTITLKNAVSFTDDRGNAMTLGATATVVSVDGAVRF
jgi:hypothetical protein